MESLLREVKGYKFEKLVFKIDDVFRRFKESFESNEKLFKEYSNFNEEVVLNLEKLQEKNEKIKNFPEYIKNYLDSKNISSGKMLNITLSSLMLFMGVIVVFVLMYVYYRLGKFDQADTEMF